jgi:hypothetical protein
MQTDRSKTLDTQFASYHWPPILNLPRQPKAQAQLEQLSTLLDRP